MNKIKETFENKKAFIPFITCGDPNLFTTEQLILTMEKNGADIIELGIPFSDPTAEGPVIQAASLRALNGGVTTDKIFEMVKRVRSKVKVPLVFMTYANVVFSYGIERFAKNARDAGINGIILPDVPYEEKEEFNTAFMQCDIDFISLIAPTSKERIAAIAKDANGFLYCVSSLGVTGVRTKVSDSAKEMINEVKKIRTDLPCAIGFGISNEEQAKHISSYADGIIVGSAIVKLIGEYKEECVPYVGEYVRKMKRAMEE